MAGALGIVVGTTFMAFHGSQGPKLGLPQMIQSRAQFGYKGVVIVLFAALFTYVAFNVTDHVLMAQGLSGAFHFNAQLVSLVVTVIAAVLAVLGHDWVHRVFRVLLAVSFPLMVVLTIGVISGHAGAVPNKTHYGFSGVGFMAEFSAAAAYNITYAPYVSDYSRYLPGKTRSLSVIFSVFFGASTSAIWLITLGAWLAVALGASDGLVGLKEAGNNFIGGLGSLTAIFSAAALVATMGMNAYGGALTLLTGIDAFHRIKPSLMKRARVLAVLALTLLWYFVGGSITANAVNTVFTALTLMLYLLVPWTATNLIDFFFVRKGHYAISEIFNPKGIYGSWSWRGLLAYVVGFLFEIPFMVLPQLGPLSYTGPIAKVLSGVDISWLVGLATTAITYLLVTRSLDTKEESLLIAKSNEDLQNSFS